MSRALGARNPEHGVVVGGAITEEGWIMKFRVALVALLAGCMVALGVGCSTPQNSWQAKNQANSIGGFIALVIVYGLCTATPYCPIGGVPVNGAPPAPVTP